MVKNGRKKFKEGNRDTDDGEVKAYLESSQYKQDVGREMVEEAQKNGVELDLEDPNVKAWLERSQRGAATKRGAAANGVFSSPTATKAKAFYVAKCRTGSTPESYATVEALQDAYEEEKMVMLQLPGMKLLFDRKTKPQNYKTWCRLLEAHAVLVKNPKAVLVSSRSGQKPKDSSKPLCRRKKRCAAQTSSEAVKAPVTQTERNVSKRQRTQEAEEEEEAEEDVGQMACCGRGCNGQWRQYRFEELDWDDDPFAEDGQ